ncbi:MAG: hypothetical protein R6U67_00290 [Sodalinema sp.]|uniref:hypothetical protein n=1 Tax=Sodalinema sp. TaxID=3080550 RepID=UPI00396F4EDB
MMEVIAALCLGILIGSITTAVALQYRHNKTGYQQIVSFYEEKIRRLKEKYEQERQDISQSIRVPSEIQVSQIPKTEVSRIPQKSSNSTQSAKTYSIKEIRKTYPRAYKTWDLAEDERLKHRYKQGIAIRDLASEFQRKPGAIRSRLKKLGLRK